MENINIVVDNDKPVRWKKIGGGSFLLGKHYIKQNEVFEARPSQIPKGFRDVLICLDVLPETGKVAPEFVSEAKKPVFTIALKGTSKFLYDILDAQGKVLNEKGLKKADAEKLIEDLSK